MNTTDLIGRTFGMLTVIGFNGVSPHRHSMWLCKCDCGGSAVCSRGNLLSGNSSSCGCIKKLITSARTFKHGRGYKDPTYNTWRAMKERCQNVSCVKYPRYGGRGISITPRWLDFANFLKDMGERPEGKTLDRIDNDGDYSPENCRWATPLEQARNKSKSGAILTDTTGRLAA